MNKISLEKLIKKDSVSAPDLSGLENNILNAVAKIERRRFVARTSFWSLLSALTSIGFVLSGSAFYQQFVAAGGRELFALLLTDTSVVLANSTNFFYSIAESMPIGTLSVSLSALAALLFSLRHLVEIQLNKISKNIYKLTA